MVEARLLLQKNTQNVQVEMNCVCVRICCPRICSLTCKYSFSSRAADQVTCRGTLEECRKSISARFSLSTEMNRLTRDWIAEPVSRYQVIRREQRGQEIFIFTVQLTTCRIGNLTTQLIRSLAITCLTIHLCNHSIQWSYLLNNLFTQHY